MGTPQSLDSTESSGTGSAVRLLVPAVHLLWPVRQLSRNVRQHAQRSQHVSELSFVQALANCIQRASQGVVCFAKVSPPPTTAPPQIRFVSQVSDGSCSDVGGFPINDVNLCQRAAAVLS